MLGPLEYTIQETSQKGGMQKTKTRKKKRNKTKRNPKRKQQFCAVPETGSSSHVGSVRAVCPAFVCLANLRASFSYVQ